jgi:hypothetical protein
MGSGQSINTDTPYTSCTSSGEEPARTKSEEGKGRRIGASTARTQASANTEHRSVIAPSREPAAHHQHDDQQIFASSKTTRALRIPQIYQLPCPRIIAHSASYPNPPHLPVLGALGDQTNNRSSAKLYSTMNQNSPLYTSYEPPRGQSVSHTVEVQPGNWSSPFDGPSTGLEAISENASRMENGNQDMRAANMGRGISSKDFAYLYASNTPNVGILRASPFSHEECDSKLKHPLPLTKPRLDYLEKPSVSFTTPFSHARPTIHEIWTLSDPISVSEAFALVEKHGFASARRMIVEKRMNKQIAETDELTDPRKKFRKLRIIFDEKMSESDQWYGRERKCEALIKRLAQEVE